MSGFQNARTKVTKEQAGEQVAVECTDIYNGHPIAFARLTKLDVLKGNHFQRKVAGEDGGLQTPVGIKSRRKG